MHWPALADALAWLGDRGLAGLVTAADVAMGLARIWTAWSVGAIMTLFFLISLRKDVA